MDAMNRTEKLARRWGTRLGAGGGEGTVAGGARIASLLQGTEERTDAAVTLEAALDERLAAGCVLSMEETLAAGAWALASGRPDRLATVATTATGPGRKLLGIMLVGRRVREAYEGERPEEAVAAMEQAARLGLGEDPEVDAAMARTLLQNQVEWLERNAPGAALLVAPVTANLAAPGARNRAGGPKDALQEATARLLQEWAESTAAGNNPTGPKQTGGSAE